MAGTLVHTKDGLKPIEQLKIGDLVLSRPKNSEQGTATGYKRVAKIFRFERKWVATFSWLQRSDEDPPHGRARKFDEVFVAPDQLVWVDRYGWLPVMRLHEPTKRYGHLLKDEDWGSSLLRLADGSACQIGGVMDCYCTNQEGVVYADYGDRLLEMGYLWDCKASPPKELESLVAFDIEEWIDLETDEPYCFTTTVFNVEVEEFHTYYIGETGLWVHDGSTSRAPSMRQSVGPGIGILPAGDGWPTFG